MTPQEAYEKRYSRPWSEAAQGVQNLWLAAWTIAWAISEETEREACAQICDSYAKADHANYADSCAEEIRARGAA